MNFRAANLPFILLLHLLHLLLRCRRLPPSKDRAYGSGSWLPSSLALLAACGGCIWAFYAVLGPTTQQISGATDVINDYYSNIKAQNYAAAYLDLSLNGQNPLTQDQYVQQAHARDTQYGRVTSYLLAGLSSNLATGTNSSGLTLTATVDVTRCKGASSTGRSCSSYNTVLTLQKVAGRWKIVDFYKI